MSDWLDHLPSQERQELRKKLRSEAEYEKIRENVKGPEDLEKEMRKNELTAELSFGLETEPALHDALKKQVEQDLREQGIENALDRPPSNPNTKKALEQGKFRLTVSAHPATHHDQLAVVAEGNVQEKLPLKPALSDRYVSQFGGM